MAPFIWRVNLRKFLESRKLPLSFQNNTTILKTTIVVYNKKMEKWIQQGKKRNDLTFKKKSSFLLDIRKISCEFIKHETQTWTKHSLTTKTALPDVKKNHT